MLYRKQNPMLFGQQPVAPKPLSPTEFFSHRDPLSSEVANQCDPKTPVDRSNSPYIDGYSGSQQKKTTHCFHANVCLKENAQ